MSTAAAGPEDVTKSDSALNNRILSGDFLGAFEEYYAEDVVMQESTGDPYVGKALNRDREEAFVESIGELHGVELLGSAVNGDRSYSEWEMEVTFKNGTRYKMSQVAVRRWKNGKVAQERFYYKG